MRLFEVDQGDALTALQVLQGLANDANQSSTMRFPEIQRFLTKYNLGIGSPESLKALINTVDPEGNVATVNDDGSVILTTTVKNPQQDTGVGQPKGPSVDAMAAKNARTLGK